MKWKDKKQSTEYELKKDLIMPFQIIDIYPPINIEPQSIDMWQNLLIWGENQTVMNSLLSEFKNRISLIYIDPPFATGGDFNLKVQIGEEREYIDRIAYKDKWKDGFDFYLNFLYERLVLMKTLLASNGSIYIHLDWHISHYVKIIMDEIFGIENFRNEIIWAYPAASVKTRQFFIRSYDTILFYSKSDNYVFNDDPNIYMEYSNRVKNALKKDKNGVFYYRGGSHNGKKLSRKVYVEQEGIFPRDVWNDIPYVRANTSEYQGFSTQKPERLLKRIILASTNENDIVADFFCGSGTTLAAAEKLGRRWIGCDINKHAIHMTRKRILNINNTYDILNWPELYMKNHKSFKIETTEKKDDINLNLDVFLKKKAKIKNQLQMIKHPDFVVKINQQNNAIMIELIDYKIHFIRVISEKIKEKIKSFSDWIDYWAIDFDSKNNIFKNMWFSYRTPKDRRLTLKSDVFRYKKTGNYKILVKLIDIFGIETIKLFQINIT